MRVLGSAGKMEMEGVTGSALAGRESNGRRRREGQVVGSLRVAVLREKEQPKGKGWGRWRSTSEMEWEETVEPAGRGEAEREDLLKWGSGWRWRSQWLRENRL